MTMYFKGQINFSGEVMYSKPSGFSPLDVPDLELWLDANDSSTITLNGSNVSQWDDKSGNGRNFEQTTPTDQPLFVSSGINGKGTIEFDASNTEMLSSASSGILSSLTEAHAFIVLKETAAATADGGWAFGNALQNAFYTFSDGLIYEDFGTSARKDGITPGVSVTNAHIYEIISASGEFTTKHNGTQSFTTATNTVEFSAGISRIGQNIFGDYFTGQVAEWVVYGGKLLDANASLLRAYLAAKWGIV